MNEIRCAIEVREDDSRQSAGILTGVLMPYGEVARDRAEMFDSGALHWPDGGVLLREQHNRQAPILRFTPVLDGDTLRIDEPIPNTQRGRDAVTLINTGVFTGLSVEFVPHREEFRQGLRVISDALLTGAGLVDGGSYAGATVSVREREETPTGDGELWHLL